MKPKVLMCCLGLLLAGCSDDTGGPPADTAPPDQGPVTDLGVDQAQIPDGPTTADLPPPSPDLPPPSPDLLPPPTDLPTLFDLAQPCMSACDCQQGLMCQAGKCIAGTKPVYCCTKPGCPLGQLCENPNGTQGICTGFPQCQSPCDCLQGLACIGGQCIAAFLPVYCCGNPGCPTGQQCYHLDNSQGTCP